MTYDGNPYPVLGQAQTCGGVKRVNGITTLHLMIIRSPTAIQILTNNTILSQIPNPMIKDGGVITSQ